MKCKNTIKLFNCQILGREDPCFSLERKCAPQLCLNSIPVLSNFPITNCEVNYLTVQLTSNVGHLFAVQVEILCNNFKLYSYVCGKSFQRLICVSATVSEVMKYRITHAVRINMILLYCCVSMLRHHRPKSRLWWTRRNTDLKMVK